LREANATLRLGISTTLKESARAIAQGGPWRVFVPALPSRQPSPAEVVLQSGNFPPSKKVIQAAHTKKQGDFARWIAFIQNNKTL